MSQINRLCTLLGLAEFPSEAGNLSVTHLQTWKPLIERAARNESPHTQELIDLVLTLAAGTHQPQCMALSHWIAGNAYFYEGNDPHRALQHYQQAEQIYNECREPLQIARLMVGKASTLIDLSQFEQALAESEKWMPLLAASSEPADQQRHANLGNTWGIACDHLGRYVEALQGYQRKLDWWQGQAQPGDEAALQTARARVNLGVVKTRLGQYPQARQDFLAARATLLQQATLAADWRDLARIDMNIAWLEATLDTTRQRQPAVVQTAFAQARQSAAHADPAGTSADLAILYLLEAEWHLHIGDTSAVDEAHLTRLRARCSQAGLSYEAARASLILARLAALQGRADIAQAAYADIIAMPIALEDPEIPYLAELGWARLCRAQLETAQAMQHYRQALGHMENVRQKISQDEQRAGYFEDKLAAYRELTQTLMAEALHGEAFQTIEQTKARTLVESVAVLSSALSSALPHATSRAAPPIAETLEQVAAHLAADTLAVQYVTLLGQVWAYLINQNGLVGPPVLLGPAPDAAAVRTGLNRIASVGTLPLATQARFAQQHIRSAKGILGQWHTRFVAPLQTLLKLNPYAQLIISPDGLLGLLPFSCLFDEIRGTYLSETHALTLTPSLTVWALIQRKLTAAHGGVIGAVVLGNTCEGRLPYSRQEAEQFARMMSTHGPVQFLADGEASRAALQAATQGARLVYLATHAVFRPDEPNYSYLELADGRLEVGDILKLALNSALVVMSACETGLGDLSGNELMGLVRAFIFAGASAVMATHWSVTDDATTALMRVFARHLSAGQPVSAALRFAQQTLLASDQAQPYDSLRRIWAHPYYWGGISAYGNALDWRI